jgi:hypothetical protein
MDVGQDQNLWMLALLAIARSSLSYLEKVKLLKCFIASAHDATSENSFIFRGSIVSKSRTNHAEVLLAPRSPKS